MTSYYLLFSALIASVIFCSLMVRLNLSASPTERCSHNAPTPTAGGLVFAGLFLGYLAFYTSTNIIPFTPTVCYYFVAACILLIVSFYDDCKPLSYRVRLITQLICALLIVTGGGIIESPVIDIHSQSVQFFLKALTIFTFLSLINATNFIDGLNGLLSLSVLITLIFAGFWINFYPPLTILHYTLIATILGFSFFNFPKGRIFMGDTGSTFLGLTLGFLALMAQPHCAVFTQPETALFNKGFVFTLLPMAFLWFDVVSTLCKRAVSGKRLTEAHREHMIHILFDKGYSHTFVTLLYAVCTTFMGYLTYQCHKEQISFLVLLGIYVIAQTVLVLFVSHVPQRGKLKHTPL
ncbi:MAG: hypothetical protein Q8S21_00690 [Candidatus Paracaedibacteraceae bacterium]|nr:hypothetical protein [Candidatus Paracaedibacteraceae bacterium]